MHDMPMMGFVLYAQDLVTLTRFYQQSFGFARADGDDAYVRLLRGALEIVVLQVGPEYADNRRGPRESAAIKPVLFVDADIATLRQAVEEQGGWLKPAAAQWSFHGATVCDGHDPEGNIFQLRSSAAGAAPS